MDPAVSTDLPVPATSDSLAAWRGITLANGAIRPAAYIRCRLFEIAEQAYILQLDGQGERHLQLRLQYI
ncbi:hypothetical protein, partial [Brucella intermedia]|uniref:hypothetical protein n=1 Tax=Brucella intermedia TaxID=94625 RepID=UPI001AECD26F